MKGKMKTVTKEYIKLFKINDNFKSLIVHFISPLRDF